MIKRILLGILGIQLILSCNHDQSFKGKMPLKLDKDILNGFDSAKWYYYCFYSIYNKKVVASLESHYIHPTLFNLDLLRYRINSDTIWYYVHRSFTSSRFPCFKLQDSIEIASSLSTKSVYYLKELGRDYHIKYSLDLSINNKAMRKQIDSFFTAHRNEVNPWFRKQAIANGL